MSHGNGLGSVYSAHHAAHNRYGFSYRVADRGPQLAAWIGSGQRVLDLGCRDGSLTQHYATGNVVTGVDVDQEALALAQERLGIETLCLDLNRERLPFGDGSFSVVVAGELLEHLVDPAAVVQEVYRVLAQDGVFVGSVPNSFHWRARLAFLRGHSLEDPTHLHLFSQARLCQLLQALPNPAENAGRSTGAQDGVPAFAPVEILPVGGIGGRALPVVPPWLSQRIVHWLPAWFANDLLFCATKHVRPTPSTPGRSTGTRPQQTAARVRDGAAVAVSQDAVRPGPAKPYRERRAEYRNAGRSTRGRPLVFAPGQRRPNGGVAGLRGDTEDPTPNRGYGYSEYGVPT
jgi:SAM-dependent methyltransferase